LLSYVVDKMAKIWPTYIPCVIMGRVNHLSKHHPTHDNKAAAAAATHSDMVQYVVRHFTAADEEEEGEEGEEGEMEGKKNHRDRKKSSKQQSKHSKRHRKTSRKKSKLRVVGSGGSVRNMEMKSDYPDGTYDTSSSESDDERENTYIDSDDDDSDDDDGGKGDLRRDSAMFDGKTTILGT
jgi:hypothetical protein